MPKHILNFVVVLLILSVIIIVLSVFKVSPDITGRAVQDMKADFSMVEDMNLKNCLAKCINQACYDICYFNNAIESDNKGWCNNITSPEIRDRCLHR